MKNGLRLLARASRVQAFLLAAWCSSSERKLSYLGSNTTNLSVGAARRGLYNELFSSCIERMENNLINERVGVEAALLQPQDQG